MPPDPKRNAIRTPVSTILTPLEPSHVDAAAQDLCDALHRESLDEVLSGRKEQKAKLVLISVTRSGSQSSRHVAANSGALPRVPGGALDSAPQNSSPIATLDVGS